MRKVAQIGTHLKKIYRTYSQSLLEALQKKGFADLRPSFLEVLLYICEHDGSSIKSIGRGCGLKKQTMTSHLNELEKRGYVKRQVNPRDKREQLVFLTEYGQKFKLSLTESVNEIEVDYIKVLGEVEMDRIDFVLQNFYQKIAEMHESK
ncbi:MAG: MarR family winged helix-turn-helix transcriptional regulator [Bacteriovoracaceae bacterium]